jgi:WD40-like Beta Propeller Repeat
MRLTRFGSASLLLVVAVPASALYACGSSTPGDGPGEGTDSGTGDESTSFQDGGTFGDANQPDAFVQGTFTAPDCPGCTFPPDNAPPCAPGAPAIDLVYPNDGVLVPPNMSTISVQWTPFGTTFSEFEVDFANGNTDVRIITKCATQTTDTAQPPTPSGGCDLELDPKMWSFVSNANRGGAPVVVTVRGTTDGKCANKSATSIKMSFAQEDVLGAIYYWKSTVTAAGVGGQIWVKSFGDAVPEALVTTNAASCNGCHALSRDGIRMTIYSDDDDSDDEYGDVRGTLIDMTKTPKVTLGGVFGPGFSTFSPDHSSFVSTNGLGTGATNVLNLQNGITGGAQTPIPVLAATDRPTMPDWSPDGKTVVFVKPTAVGQWDGTGRKDDDHVFGGSLFTLPYNGGGAFGAAAPLLTSAGENNYYPSYSPDGQFLMFNRAPKDGTVATIDGCVGTAPQRACPNDSFSNPAARVMLLSTGAGAQPVDLEAANGSPAAAPQPLSNSWPRWSPFVQTYKGQRLLWITFSSTRDYGLLVRNHKTGMYQCYPADSFEDPGSAHGQKFQPVCQQPQLWMAAVNLDPGAKDPSYTGFWLPFQDVKTHNHTPQWTQAIADKPPPADGGACIPSAGDCRTNPGGCCSGLSCGADGTCSPIIR